MRASWGAGQPVLFRSLAELSCPAIRKCFKSANLEPLGDRARKLINFEVNPLGWTLSGRRLDQLPSVFLLEPHRRQITKRRMQPARVVHFIDEPRKPLDDIGDNAIV